MTDTDPHRRIQRMCEDAAFQRAATELLKLHGNEILAFLTARLEDQADARDAFGMFSEDLWRGLPRFEWRCPPRAWMFTLARHAQARFVASVRRGTRRGLTTTALSIPVRPSTLTAPHQRTEVKNAFRALRARLSDEDRLILILRVDRALDWNEIGFVMRGDGNAEVSGPELEREVARLRKRFQLIKQKLRVWAEADGLLPLEVSSHHERGTE